MRKRWPNMDGPAKGLLMDVDPTQITLRELNVG